MYPVIQSSLDCCWRTVEQEPLELRYLDMVNLTVNGNHFLLQYQANEVFFDTKTKKIHF